MDGATFAKATHALDSFLLSLLLSGRTRGLEMKTWAQMVAYREPFDLHCLLDEVGWYVGHLSRVMPLKHPTFHVPLRRVSKKLRCAECVFDNANSLFSDGLRLRR